MAGTSNGEGGASSHEGGEAATQVAATAKAAEASSTTAKLGKKLADALSLQKKHAFWETQPVGQFKEAEPLPEGVIDSERDPSKVKPEPYNLPANFEWSTCDIDDADTMKEIYTLLTNNYVEDDDNMFRFDYSEAFLLWALKPPGFLKAWHVGVRGKSTKKLVAFISGVPATICVRGSTIRMAEINFLCVHKKLRSKRLAPVLIKEVTRRVHVENMWQAVYTAGVVLPVPVGTSQYFHRSLNPKKLLEVGFSRLAPRMTVARTIKLYRLPTETATPGLRPMEPRDTGRVMRLLAEYLGQFEIFPSLDEEDVAHLLLPREGVVNSYVVEDPQSHEVTDFCSFYSLPSTIIGHETHSTLRAAYSYYNVTNKTPLNQLMNDALILAKNLDYDVFNALDIMHNEKFLKDLKFGAGDGHLHYYLYNYRISGKMEPSKIGLVML